MPSLAGYSYTILIGHSVTAAAFNSTCTNIADAIVGLRAGSGWARLPQEIKLIGTEALRQTAPLSSIAIHQFSNS